jgi:hypothetical protein
VHNLYRNKWSNIILHKDNFAQEAPPEPWAIEFRNEALDALTLNTVSRTERSHACEQEAHFVSVGTRTP